VKRVAPPALLFGRVDPGHPVEAPLDWPQDAVKWGRAPFVKGKEPEAHRFGKDGKDRDEGENEHPSGQGHGIASGQKRSGRSSATTR
jgi:hypothetical protein